jgi:hypothetical protein
MVIGFDHGKEEDASHKATKTRRIVLENHCLSLWLGGFVRDLILFWILIS